MSTDEAVAQGDPIRAQIERRQKRGAEELRRIVNRGHHPVYSTFEVTSQSGRSYRVRIRDLEELRNTCTCPDYRSNLIGTCKHIEGVLAQLRQQHGKRLARLAADRPTTTAIYLHHAEEVTVRLAPAPPGAAELPDLLARYFDPAGLLQGPLLHTLPALLHELDGLPPAQRAAIEVDDAVAAHLALLRDQEGIGRQKTWFQEQVREGHRSLNLLSVPLFGYQEEGTRHLAFGRRALLADDMGLGKTITGIAAAVLLKQLRDVERVLVVCPASLKHQWAREAKRFTDLSVQVIGGPTHERRRQYAAPAFFNIVNYELVRRDTDELRQLRPDIVVLDEAQRIKNWRTKTADAVKRLASPYAFVLTGTPLENRLDELYSVFQFLDPRILGPLWRFNEQFYELEQTPRGAFKVVGYQNLDQLRARIAPYVLRRTRDEVLLDLPPRTDNNYFVEITPEQRQAYDDYGYTVAKLVAKAHRRPLTPQEHQILLGALIKMRLICNALALHDPSLDEKARERTAPKLRELREIVADEVQGHGRKAIIFSQWTGMLNLAAPVLDRLGVGHVTLSGDVPTARRGEVITRFLEDEDCRVLLSTDAGGTGLNLQAASLVVNLDLPWNPAVLEQRIARAHRHGQARGVQVVNLIAQGTIEERLLDSLAAKRSVFQGVFGADEAPDAIRFQDLGQSLLQTLDDMLGPPDGAPPEIELAPAEAAEGELATPPLPADGASGAGAQPAGPTPPGRSPLATFADLVVARFPGRVLLVRALRAVAGVPAASGVLVVVDAEPAALRATIEGLAGELWPVDPPPVHLMEREGYRAMAALLGDTPDAAGEGEPFRAPALPRTTNRNSRERRLARATTALAEAERRLRLAEVVLAGGFPEEAAQPLRAALGQSLGALLALHATAETGDGAAGSAPGADPAALPAPRTVQARLVEPGHLPADLAARLAQVRDLTAPPQEAEPADALSAATAAQLVATVRDLVTLAREQCAGAAVRV